MTTQDIERPRKVAYSVEHEGPLSMRIFADDPEVGGRTAAICVGNAFASSNGFGAGPIFTADVMRATSG